MHVFLDLWGVLLDSDRMQEEYGRRLARRMAERFGGPEDRWLQAHTAAWTEYVRAVDSADWSRGSWAATVADLDARFALRLLERAGAAWRPSDALAFSRELERETMSTVDARFPDARRAIERLRAAGHRVYVTTQATDSNARGALAGAGLLDAVDAVFTGTSQDAPKTGTRYWTGVLSTVNAPPHDCVVVDDRADYLQASATMGCLGLLLDRDGIYEPEMIPRFVRATLRNLAGLPHFVDVLASERDRTST
ncbi:MAG TPA: HAD family hydrolase [Thermoplasmata archaeon]|nr:HAD family hydrolase [Thermoplasmata archaeon]